MSERYFKLVRPHDRYPECDTKLIGFPPHCHGCPCYIVEVDNSENTKLRAALEEIKKWDQDTQIHTDQGAIAREALGNAP